MSGRCGCLKRAGFFVALMFPAMAWAPVVYGETTLEHLHQAFVAEVKAHARYLAFAQQADDEGYGEVASLFRAAARSEEIHAENHLRVIRRLGGSAGPPLEIPRVQRTEQNLRAAIGAEKLEHEQIYAEYLKQARQENNSEAAAAFAMAGASEAQHEKLFRSALARLSQLKGSAHKIWYVCPVCGYTTGEIGFENCPVCETPKERFESGT